MYVIQKLKTILKKKMCKFQNQSLIFIIVLNFTKIFFLSEEKSFEINFWGNCKIYRKNKMTFIREKKSAVVCNKFLFSILCTTAAGFYDFLIPIRHTNWIRPDEMHHKVFGNDMPLFCNGHHKFNLLKKLLINLKN